MASQTIDGPLRRYQARVSQGTIAADPAQEAAALKLDALARELESVQAHGRGLLGSLFGARSPRTTPPRGLYIHGAVGRGKTMLMDIFFEAVAFGPKRRVHFHAFMAEVHALLAAARATETQNVVGDVATTLAMNARLLCFDELSVNDIADAMILGRLFEALWQRGVVMVATSNQQPSDLYKNGLKRENFLPFIALIEEHMAVLELVSARDFRLAKLTEQALYHTPLGPAATRAMAQAFEALASVPDASQAPLVMLEIQGRILSIRGAHGVAFTTFDQLCRATLGAGDYLALARAFHTVVLDGVPILSPAHYNEARRFITLIDTLYDRGVALIVSADAEPDALYPAGDDAHLFERTASRLIEMRSGVYLAQARARASALKRDAFASNQKADT